MMKPALSKQKIICLVIYILLILGGAQNPPDFPSLSNANDFSGDLSRFFLEPVPLANEISGNVVGPEKMPGVNFTSIQDALNRSGPNATIYVLSGVYNESINLSNPGVILKGINTGEGAPVISAVGHISTITVSASACTVDGFVVMNSGNPEAGIVVFSEGNTISNNVLTNNRGYGIHLSRSSGNTIHGNMIAHNGFDGIYLEGSLGNLIASNSGTENGMNGLYLHRSDKNIIKGNLFLNNSQDGILLINSSTNIIIENSYDSIREENSRDNIIEGNSVLSLEDTSDDRSDDTKRDDSKESAEPLFISVAPGENLQQAINSISPGGTIEMPDGTYDGPIVIDEDNITILGGGLTEIRGNGVDSTITLLGAGVTLNGVVITNSGNPHSGIEVMGVSCLIQDCQIRDNRGYGISITSSHDCRIENNTIANNGLGGITAQSCQNNLIDRNNIAGNGGNGILFDASSDNTISDNIATGSEDGIRFSDSSSNTISANTATGNTLSGITLIQSSGNTISDNIANGNSQTGINLDHSSNNTVLSNTATGNEDGIRLYRSAINTVSENTIGDEYGGNSICGINLDLSNGNGIWDNKATSNGNYGIHLSTSNSNTISGNTANSNEDGICLLQSNGNSISNNTANENYNGVDLSDSSNNTISSNTATCNNCGICLSTSSGNTISHNTATNNGNYGIFLDRSNGNSVWDNTAISNGHGIYLSTASDNTISHNTATSNINYGIDLSSSSSNTISSNIVTLNKGGIYLMQSSGNSFSFNEANFNTHNGVDLSASSNNIISGNRVEGNDNYGIFLDRSNGNSIWKNTFDNINNSRSDGNNHWNTTNIGKRYGNRWSDYHGNNTNGDDIGDDPYPISGGLDCDYYPLLIDIVPTGDTSVIHISLEGYLQKEDSISRARYVMRITNPNDVELNDVHITDQLSQGIRIAFVKRGLQPDNTAVDSNGKRTLKWNYPGPLRQGEIIEIELVAVLESVLPETFIVNNASVQATTPDNVSLRDKATLVLDTAADISIEKEADPSFATASDTVTFSINVTNTGQKDLVSVIADDILPEKMSYVSDDSNASLSSRILTWELGPLNSGESKFISLVCRVKEDVSGVQTNTVSVTGTTANMAEVSDSDSVEVDILSLNVMKQADRKTVKRGENITYTINICNSGSLPLDDVIAWDVIDFSQVILLYSSMETEEDGKWHLGTLAPGQCAMITLMVHVPDSTFRFDMTSSVSGVGYVNVADDYITTLPAFVIKNTVYALSANTSRQSEDTSLVTVLGEDGTELSSREHGSGSYQGEELLRMITENKSIEMNKSLTARYQPVTLSLYNGRTINQSSPWTERIQARNRVTGLSMTESFSHAQSISRQSRIKLDENESVLESSTEFEGLARIEAEKKDRAGRTSFLDAEEDYAGSFKVYQKIDEYGSGVNYRKIASGTGFVAADKRIGGSQRSHESGTGNYSSEEAIATFTNYIYKDIDLTSLHVPLNLAGLHRPNQLLNWSEGIYSRDPGSTYLGEEYSSLESLEKQTLAAGLNYISSQANFTGRASYRQVIEGELDMEQQYLGRYAINYKANLQGTARFDRPHLNVIKNGEIVRPANQTKTYARYKITVENDGNKMLSPIYIKDLFPPGAVYVNSTLRPSLTASSANWTLTHLAVGGRSEIILWLEIGDDVSSSLVNRVEATGGHESGWASANNVSVLECGWLPCVPAEDQLLVKKSAYLNASSGDFVWYLLRIENRGNCTASLTVTDRLPGGMELVQATPDITRYNRSSNAIVWNVLAIEPQGMMTIIYKVQIIKGGRLVNQVKVEAFSPEGCDIKPAYDSIVLTMGNESDNERDQTQSDDWAPPEDWGMQCTDSSCLNLDLMI